MINENIQYNFNWTLFLLPVQAEPEIVNMSNNQNEINSLQDESLESFGYKVSWYVISDNELKRRNLTIQKLAMLLGLHRQENLPWNKGLERIFEQYYDENSGIFITPNINGNVYIIAQVKDELDLLDGKLDNFYGFTSYRVVGAVAWKIVKNGKIERYFTYADGRVYHNEGNQTQAEKQLNLVDLSGLDVDEAIDKIFEDFEKPTFVNITDEEIPAKINEILTGQNPLKFEEISVDEVKDKGIVGFLPN